MIEKLSKEIIKAIVDDNCDDITLITPVDADVKLREEVAPYFRPIKNTFDISAKKYKILCTCKECGGKVVENTVPDCPFCGRGYSTKMQYHQRPDKAFVLLAPKTRERIDEIIKEENLSRIKLWYKVCDSVINKVSRYERLQTYYVREKGDGSFGIDIVRLRICYAADDDGNINEEEKYDCYTEIVPGQKIKAYKTTKAKGKEEISLFDAFHITSGNVLKDENVVFEGAASMLDFMYYNKQFAERTGLLNLLINYKGKIPENSFFLLYMYLLSEYPVIELLVKMGYYTLVLSLFNEIAGAYFRDTIRQRVSKLSNLLNQTTKGSASLSIPTYVGEFLNQKGAEVGEYMAWAAINELHPLSKEQFEKFLGSEAYMYFNYYDLIRLMPNIMKYGYKPFEITKYAMKQYFSQNEEKINLQSTEGRWGVHGLQRILELWKDYLQMCELLGVEAARFPKNLQSVHDDASAAISAKRNASIDKKLKAIADSYKDFKSESSTLCIKFPECVNDFVIEGNQQHNCVAGYSSRVYDGYCRIFFIRKKENPEESYITAECGQNGLGQLMYRNNNWVNDFVETNLAKAVCKHILSKSWEPKDWDK